MERLSYLVCIIIDILSLILIVGIMYEETVKDNPDECCIILCFFDLAFIVWSLIYVTNRPPQPPTDD